MSDRSTQLAEKRDTLRTHCAMQRDRLAGTAHEIDAHLGGIDRTVSIVRGIVRHPAIAVGSAALLLLIGPGRVLRLVSRGVVMYGTARRIARLVRSR